MKNFKIVGLFIAILLFANSCSKSKIDILTSTIWLPDSLVYLGNNAIMDCMKDDEITFSKAGKGTYTPAGIPCVGGTGPMSTDFTLSEDGKTLSGSYTITLKQFPVPYTLKVNLNVEELSSTALRASATSPVAIRVAFKAKK